MRWDLKEELRNNRVLWKAFLIYRLEPKTLFSIMQLPPFGESYASSLLFDYDVLVHMYRKERAHDLKQEVLFDFVGVTHKPTEYFSEKFPTDFSCNRKIYIWKSQPFQLIKKKNIVNSSRTFLFYWHQLFSIQTFSNTLPFNFIITLETIASLGI